MPPLPVTAPPVTLPSMAVSALLSCRIPQSLSSTGRGYGEATHLKKARRCQRVILVASQIPPNFINHCRSVRPCSRWTALHDLRRDIFAISTLAIARRGRPFLQAGDERFEVLPISHRFYCPVSSGVLEAMRTRINGHIFNRIHKHSARAQ